MELVPTAKIYKEFTDALLPVEQCGGKNRVKAFWYQSSNPHLYKSSEAHNRFHTEVTEWIKANKVHICLLNGFYWFEKKEDLLYFQIKW